MVIAIPPSSKSTMRLPIVAITKVDEVEEAGQDQDRYEDPCEFKGQRYVLDDKGGKKQEVE